MARSAAGVWGSPPEDEPETETAACGRGPRRGGVDPAPRLSTAPRQLTGFVPPRSSPASSAWVSAGSYSRGQERRAPTQPTTEGLCPPLPRVRTAVEGVQAWHADPSSSGRRSRQPVQVLESAGRWPGGAA